MSLLRKLGKINLFVAAVLICAWVLVATKYYGTSEPITKAEADIYVEKMLHLFKTVGVPDGQGGGDVPKILADLRSFMDEDDGKPFYMLNLMKTRDKAVFRDHIKGVEGMTVDEAALRYNEELFSHLITNNGHPVYLTTAKKNAMSFGSTDDSDNWDEISIFRYCSRRDFFNMLTSEEYLDIVYFKLAAMGTITLVPTQPFELMSNPVPNFPVLMGFGFIIAFLLLLVGRRRRD